jgi:ABC-type multidrug transport system fused ATPase/permease subunit
MRTIQQEDLWRLTDKLSIAMNYPKFEANLKKQLERNESEEWPKTALTRAFLRTNRYELLMSFLLKCLSSISEVMQPLLTENIINNIQKGDSVGKGVGYSMGVAALIILTGLLADHAFNFSFTVSAHVHAIMTKSLLEKSILKRDMGQLQVKLPP